MNKKLTAVIFLMAVLLPLAALGSNERSRELDRFDKLVVETSGELTVVPGRDFHIEINGPSRYVSRIRTEVRDRTLYIDVQDWFLRVEDMNYVVTVPNLVSVKTTSSCDILIPGMEGEELSLITSSSGEITAGRLKGGDIRIKTSSSGSITIESAEGDELGAVASSSGDITLGEVTADEVSLKSSSGGDLFLNSLNTDELRVILSSSGNCQIDSGRTGGFDLKCSSSGDYSGGNIQSDRADVTLSSSGDAEIRTSGLLNARLTSSGDLYVNGTPELGTLVTSGSGAIHRR